MPLHAKMQTTKNRPKPVFCCPAQQVFSLLELARQEQLLERPQLEQLQQQVLLQLALELQQQELQLLQFYCKRSERVQAEQPTERSESLSYPLIK
jgi:hypothetical protein